MTVGVVAYGVAAAFYLFKEFGEHLNIFSYAEECGFGVIFVENIKYPWGYLGSWTVIKGEEDAILFVGKIPDESGEQFPDYFWRFYSHKCGVWIGKSNNKNLPL